MMISPSITVVGVDWECISTSSPIASGSARTFFSVNYTEFRTPSTLTVPKLAVTAVE